MNKPEMKMVEVGAIDPRLRPRGFRSTSFDHEAFRRAYPQLQVVRNHLGEIAFSGPETRPPLPDLLPYDKMPSPEV